MGVLLQQTVSTMGQWCTQLTASSFLTSCIPEPLPTHNNNSSSSSSSSSSRAEPQLIQDLVSQAEAAPLALPPEATAACWDQQVTQLHTCARCAAFKPPAAGSVLELGCGTGASAVWLARQGYHVSAVDVVQAALDAAAGKAAAAGLPVNNPRFIQQDIMQLCSCDSSQPSNTSSSTSGGSSWGSFDLIYDCQVYHALVKDDSAAQAKLPQLLHGLLKPGGLLLMLTGNANEPEIGPAVLSGQQLLGPLIEAGLECVFLRQTQFDRTSHYVQELRKRPLAC
ncbi:S-adenosyl-L-methionine-dependent methyltransferase [Scenedesmus sp. NREL 46B-D3]|nr:S-adenosyl-L-methionine-dependent methyltransferase [Scenedesmus sp. NREL 46B-D3]